MKHKKQNKIASAAGTYLLLAVLVCLIFGSIFFARSKNAQVTFEPAPAEEAAPETAQPVNTEIEPTPEALPAPGTLLSSGSGLNENYYGKFHFSGMISELGDISFVMGRGHAVTDLRSGEDHPGSLTVYYGEDTVIKTARLYYQSDSFEIYMGSPEDLTCAAGYMYEVVLKDPDANALWATEICISEFIY